MSHEDSNHDRCSIPIINHDRKTRPRYALGAEHSGRSLDKVMFVQTNAMKA